MPKLFKHIAVIAGLFLGTVGIAGAVSIFQVQQGGTGAGTFTPGQLLYGSGTNPFQSVATTSVTCSGATSCNSFTVIGSTPITISSAAGGSGTVTNIATTFPILGGPITTTGTLTFGGLSTSSAISAASGLLYATGVNTLASVSTSSPVQMDITGNAGGTALNVTGVVALVHGGTGLSSISGNQIIYTNSSGTAYVTTATSSLNLGVSGGGTGAVTLTGCLTGNGTGAITGSGTCNTSNATVSSVAQTVPSFLSISGSPITTSGTLAIALSGQALGIGTTTPYGQLSVATTTSQNLIPLFVVGSSTVSNIPLMVNGFGKIVATDQVNSWTGVVSPTRNFALGTGTTTTWTASTTASAYTPEVIMPFGGTLRTVSCVPYVNGTAGSFLGVNVQVNGSNATPTYFVASSTVGTETFTAGNTFTKGQIILANFGTTTTATATAISCTFSATETP